MYLYLYLYLHIFVSICTLYIYIYIFQYLYLYIIYLYLCLFLYLYIYILMSCHAPSRLPVYHLYSYVCVNIYIYIHIYILLSVYLSAICLLMSPASYLHLSWHIKYKWWIYWPDLSWTAFTHSYFLAEWRQNILTIKSDRNSQLIASVFQK